MATNILTEILSWSSTRPAWQRDALRRLFTKTPLDAADVSDLADICKAVYGLATPKQPEPLEAKHLAIATTSKAPVNLRSLTHHIGVNALAQEQTVEFGPALTVVYGDNGSGKSGYSRILKRACRSRFVENILGDVLSTATPLAPRATITIQGTPDTPIPWSLTTDPSPELAAVSVFDAHCVPAYLKDKTDVAFRPFGLDVFDGLASTCVAVRRLLEGEKNALHNIPFVIPVAIEDGTAARTFVSNLTALSKDTDLVALATLTEKEEQRLKALEVAEQDIKASDPKQRAKELGQKVARLQLLVTHIGAVIETVDLARVSELTKLRAAVNVARQAVEALRKTMLRPESLPATGSTSWRTLWEAADAFSKSAADAPFPPELGDRCPFCQQDIGSAAADRLKHFSEFVASTAQADVTTAEQAYMSALDPILALDPNRSHLIPTLTELAADDESAHKRVEQCLGDAVRIVDSARAGRNSFDAPFIGMTFDPTLMADLATILTNLRQRVTQLEQSPSVMNKGDATALSELRARVALHHNIDAIRAEIERKGKLNAYSRAIDDTVTNQITLKSTELTKTLITDQLRKQFQHELQGLSFTHLLVEIQAAGGSKGALFHKLVFSNAPGVQVTDVLSEGESRALSLAAFLTELSTAPNRSAVVFDDPVSSLDHIWRERIARRLVEEARLRQVIVFTHDLVFLRSLMAIADKESLECKHQYLRRDGQSGITSSDLPWVAMPVNKRLGVLNKRLQDATATFNKKGATAYENERRELFAMLRETWERGITEVLLNDTVDRYRQSIETKRVAFLHDITEQDCKDVENGMTEASRWMRGHDEAPAEGTPFPSPTELRKRIDECEDWAKRIRKRR